MNTFISNNQNDENSPEHTKNKGTNDTTLSSDSNWRPKIAEEVDENAAQGRTSRREGDFCKKRWMPAHRSKAESG
jgi:hypothetical protein